MTDSTTGSIPTVAAADEQHMLLLFLPLYKGALDAAMAAASHITGGGKTLPKCPADPGIDQRANTGVHFAMFFGLKAGAVPAPGPPASVPSFTTPDNKDLLVVQAIYDGEFSPYINAFTDQPSVACALDEIVAAIDESGIDIPDPATSAASVMKLGVAKDARNFVKLLMRYNFSDPLVPAVSGPMAPPPPVSSQRFILVGTFPGLTVGNVLNNYPDAATLWPYPPPPTIYE